MIEETKKKIFTAKKDMDCQASWFCTLYGFDEDDCKSKDDKAAFRRAIAENGKILKGQKFVRVTTWILGVKTTYNSRPEMQYIWERLSSGLAYKPK